MPEEKECVLKLAPECPTNGFWFIYFPNPDSKTVVYACGRCVGTLVRQRLAKRTKNKPEPMEKK